MQDKDNGTQVPDLGPKFYIARPLLRRQKGQKKYAGYTFTPLHCDLADAVNYSCWGAPATWHIFHRKDRPSKWQRLAFFTSIVLDHIKEIFLAAYQSPAFHKMC